MMKKIVIALFCGFSYLIYGQDISDSLNIEPFSKIEIYDGIVFYLERADNNTIYGVDKTLAKDLSITFEKGTLKIRKITGQKYDDEPTVKVKYSQLKEIFGYGRSNIHTQNLIKDDSVHVVLKSGAIFYGSFDVKFLDADVTEGCLFTGDGYANNQVIKVNLKATFSGFELEGITADVKATTGGIAKVNISEKLNAYATTGGYIGYKNSPKIEKRTSLGGKIVNDKD
jgi:hypothetical protein